MKNNTVYIRENGNDMLVVADGDISFMDVIDGCKRYDAVTSVNMEFVRFVEKKKELTCYALQVELYGYRKFYIDENVLERVKSDGIAIVFEVE